MGKDSIAVETTPYTLGAPISWNGQNGTAITNATTPAPLAAGGNATSATGAGNSTEWAIRLLVPPLCKVQMLQHLLAELQLFPSR